MPLSPPRQTNIQARSAFGTTAQRQARVRDRARSESIRDAQEQMLARINPEPAEASRPLIEPPEPDEKEASVVVDEQPDIPETTFDEEVEPVGMTRAELESMIDVVVRNAIPPGLHYITDIGVDDLMTGGHIIHRPGLTDDDGPMDCRWIQAPGVGFVFTEYGKLFLAGTKKTLSFTDAQKGSDDLYIKVDYNAETATIGTGATPANTNNLEHYTIMRDGIQVQNSDIHDPRVG